MRAIPFSTSLLLVFSLFQQALPAPAKTIDAKTIDRAGQLLVVSTSLQTTRQPSDEIALLTDQLKTADEEERRDAALKLSALESPATIPALTSILNDPSEKIRALAITALGRVGDSTVVAMIAARLSQDKKPFVRKAAAFALGRLHSGEGTAGLIAALKDKDKEVRGAAAVALGEYEDASAIAALEQAISDKAEFVRAQSARALGANGRAAARSTPLLIKLLTSDKEQEVRRQAATALGRIGDRAALPALERAARDRDPYLSDAAIEAIKKITGVGS